MNKFISAILVCILYASIVRGYLDQSVLSDDLKDLIATLHKTCSEKTGIDKAMIKKTEDGEFANDKKLKCYMKCILAEGGAMEENGNIDFTAIEELVPDSLKQGIENMFNKCVPKAQNSDLCERSFEFYTCCYKVDPKAYFLL